MWVPTLGQEDPLEEGMATHFSIHAWRIPMDRKAWRAIVYRVTKTQHVCVYVCVYMGVCVHGCV